jgi:hypothetical protein
MAMEERSGEDEGRGGGGGEVEDVAGRGEV